MNTEYSEKSPSSGNPEFHNKLFPADDGWKPYFSWMKSSSSCVSLMCLMSLGQDWLCCWASPLAVGREEKEKKNIRSVGGGGQSPRHHLSRPFMELSSGGLRELAHFPIRASQPHLLSLRDPGTQCVWAKRFSVIGNTIQMYFKGK